jgi:hypothetical protein
MRLAASKHACRCNALLARQALMSSRNQTKLGNPQQMLYAHSWAGGGTRTADCKSSKLITRTTAMVYAIGRILRSAM